MQPKTQSPNQKVDKWLSFNFFFLRDHSSITSAKKWSGWGQKMAIFADLSTIYAYVGGWMGEPKKAKNMLT